MIYAMFSLTLRRHLTGYGDTALRKIMRKYIRPIGNNLIHIINLRLYERTTDVVVINGRLQQVSVKGAYYS